MKSHSRPYIILLFLGGGTLTDRHRPVTNTTHVASWLRQVAEMNMIADIEGVFVASGQAPIGIPDWQQATAIIHERYAEADGFVIAHQGETVSTAGAMLSLMLRGVGKPVVLSGTPSASTPTTAYGIKANIINAVQVATADLAGVVTVAGSHILRADDGIGNSRTTSPAIIGKIEFGIRLFGQQARRHHRAWRVRSTFETHVVSIDHIPGVNIRQSVHIPRGTKALFFSLADSPWSAVTLVSEVRALTPADLPLVAYVGTQPKLLTGVVTVAASSRAVALMRLMWALGQTSNRRQLQVLLNS